MKNYHFFYAKPTKCPSCGHTHFQVAGWEGPYNKKYWKCSNCGYKIQD